MTQGRFDRSRRLLTAADFKRVFQQAERSRDRYFTILCRRNDGDTARLGLAVSRKTDKRAVARNRIKRQVRESFRKLVDNRADYVVISNPSAAAASTEQLRASLQGHWRRLEKTPGRQTHRNTRRTMMSAGELPADTGPKTRHDG